MKLSCSREALREALRAVVGIIDAKVVKDVLKNVRLRTVDGALELSATDLDVGVKSFVRDVEIERSGGVLVPADGLLGLMNESRLERVALEVEGAKLTITGTGSRFTFVGAPPEEFPEIPEFDDDQYVEVIGGVLREMIDKTIFAVAQEQGRYGLEGVLLVLKQRSARVEMVATDGRRLALIRRKANAASPVTATGIIPVKALKHLQKTLKDEEVVKVWLRERQVGVAGENDILVAQLVEGRFPPYEEVIPTDCDKKLDVDREEFVNALRQADVVSARETRAVRLRASAGRLEVEASDPARGEAHVEIPATYDGEPIEIVFSSGFLLDGAKAMDEETVRLEMKDRNRAAVMRRGTDYIYLVMPMALE